jgi:hypothetical protein
VEKWLLEDDSGRKLRFFFLDRRNNRVCGACYVDNNRLVQASRLTLQLTPVSQGPPRKRHDVFTFATPSTPKTITGAAITTPPSVTITDRPRNSRRRKIPHVDDSPLNMETPISIPRMPGRSEAAHIVAQEFAAQLPDTITLSSRSWIASLMSFPCGNEKNGNVCGGHLDPFDQIASRLKVELKFVCSKCKAASSFFAYPAGEQTLEYVGPDEKKHKVKEDDMRTVVKVLLSGATQQQYSILQAGELKIAKSTFYAIQKLICAGIVRVTEACLEEERRVMRRAFELGERTEWQAACNGAWSHRGWTARHHTFQVRDNETQTVVCSIVLAKSHYTYSKAGVGEPVVATAVYDGNYVGSSRAMENEAFEMALAQLRAAGLLKYLKVIVADGDLGIDSFLKKSDDTKHIRIAGDAGHAKKNFWKAMKDVCGVSGPYMGLPYRISNFWMRCIKRAEKIVHGHTEQAVSERLKVFKQLWAHVLAHYTRKDCPKSCPCNEFYQNGETEGDDYDEMAREAERFVNSDVDGRDDEVVVVVPEILFDDPVARTGKEKLRFVAKKFLNASNPKEKQLVEQLKTLLVVAEENAGYVLWALNTCAAEGANFRRLVFCRKDRFYYASYTARSCLSSLVDNYGLEETYCKIAKALEFSQRDIDGRVCADLQGEDERRAWHSKRKKSTKYNDAQKNAKMWKAGHNIDVKEAANEKNKLKRSSYKTSQSDGRQVFDLFQRKRGRQSQAQLRELFQKNMANQCRQCGKFYSKNGRHNKCTGVWKEHGLQAKENGKLSKRQKNLELDFKRGKAKQCSNCKLYYKKNHKKCRKVQLNAGESENEENVVEENSGSENGEAHVEEEVEEEIEEDYDALDVSENGSESEVEIENPEADEERQQEFDEQDLLTRNLVIPSDEDIEQMQLDESEIKNLEKKIMVEAPFMSCFATLLQKEVGGVNMEEEQIPAVVFGPTLMLKFSDRDEDALKMLLHDFSPRRVLLLMLTKAENHYVVVELNWFDSFVTVYDSSRDTPKSNGQKDMREVCAKYLDVPLLERVFRVLDMVGEGRVWRFAEDMPQQDNGRDCGIFAMEVARTRVRAALVADNEKARAEKDYQNLSQRRAASYRRRLGGEFRSKKCDLNAKL